MNELRLAARDFVTDPGTPVAPGRRRRDGARRGPEEDPAGARARAAGHDRRRHRAPVDLPQRHRADFRADQPPRRTDRRACRRCAKNSMPRLPRRPIPRSPRPCFRPRAGSLRRCWRVIRRRPNRPRKACARMTITDSKLRAAVDDYAEAIISISIRERQIADIDKEVLGAEGRLIQRVTELLREVSERRGHVLVPRFCADARRSQVAEHRARHRRRPDRAVGVAAGGPPHRASACLDRNLDPRGGRRRKETPRSRRPTSTTRSATLRAPPKCSASTLVDADAAREAAVRALAEQRLAEESYRKLFEGPRSTEST